MPFWNVDLTATAHATISVEADTELEAREIADLEGFEISDTNELTDFEVVSATPERVLSRNIGAGEVRYIEDDDATT